MKYTIKIKGKSRPYYDVTLSEKEKNITINCSCPAGELGLTCHHKMDLINGEVSTLYDVADTETFNQIISLIKRTNYYELLQEYIQIKQDIVTLKNNEKNFRKMLERTMQNGLKVNVKQPD